MEWIKSNIVELLFNLIGLLFGLWVIFGRGAERLEGTFTSGFLFHPFAPRWTAQGIRLFVALILILDGIWFVFKVLL